VNWTEGGTEVSTSASYSFTANINRTLVANFSQIAYTITTSSSPVGGGTTSGGGTVNCGSNVTVCATANACYSFANWTEISSLVSTSACYTFTAANNRTLVANFTRITYTITTSSSPVGGGTTSGGGTVNCGSNVTVCATANACYSFANWTVNSSVVSTSICYTFLPNGNANLVASFASTTCTVFQITGLAIQGNNVLVTWLAPEGSTNVVQATNGGVGGSYSNNFVPISPLILIPGPNPAISVSTNYLDVGGATNRPARYYRVAIGNVTGIVVTQALDNAADSAYSIGWLTNGGTGFGPWVLTQTSTDNYCNGFFVGSSTNSPPHATPGIDVSSKSWGIYANSVFCSGPNIAAAYRAFASGPVQVGGQLLLDMDNGSNDVAGSAVGFTLRNGDATNSSTAYTTGARLQFYLAGGSADYTVVDAAGARDSGVPLTYTGMHLIFAPGTNDTYTLTIITYGSGSTNTISGTLDGPPSSTLDSIALFNNDNGAGPPHDVFFNSLEIIGP
jgi:hypothetical protein